MEKKAKRKVHSGEVYNKERTKAKLTNTVGKILVKEGFQNIKINKVSELSGVSKKMIYEYFGGIEGLINAYLQQVDFWKIEERKMRREDDIEVPTVTQEFMFELLKSDFEYFYKSTEMQKIVLWGISEKNKLIRAMNDESEKLGEVVFKKANEIFKNTEVDYRATTAIFVAAIYYMVLHAKINGSTMNGIDLSTEGGKERVFNAIERLLKLTYKHKSARL